jgi:membrane protein
MARERRDGGRTTDHPAEIPPRGWKDIILRTYHSLSEDRVTALAAGVTYYVLLAFFAIQLAVA